MADGPAADVTELAEQALEVEEAADPFRLAGQELTSRLLLGTGGVPSLDVLARAIEASGTQLVTVALRLRRPHAVHRLRMRERERPADGGPTGCVVRGRLAPHVHEHLLGHLLGLRSIHEHPQHESEDSRRERVVDDRERLAIAGGDAHERIVDVGRASLGRHGARLWDCCHVDQHPTRARNGR